MGELIAGNLIVVRGTWCVMGLGDHGQYRMGIATQGHFVVAERHPVEVGLEAGAQRSGLGRRNGRLLK